MRIDTISGRSALSARREPYWAKIREGCYLGYRKTESGSGAFIARYRDEEGKQHYRKLGDIAAFEKYDDATDQAREWFKQCEGGVINADSVEAALRAYVDDRRIQKGEKTAHDAEKRFVALVYGKKLGRKKLDKLKPKDVLEWRNALATKSTPAHTNRNLNALKAGLNWAKRNGLCISTEAWKDIQKVSGANESRDIYLTVEERQKLITNSHPDLADFIRGLLYTGARPQELASTKVSDFDLRTASLRLVHYKGNTAEPKERYFPLSPNALEFFKRITKNRIGNQPLMTCNGEGWYSAKGHGRWIPMMKKARRTAGLSEGVTSYVMRHCCIADWLVGGIDPASVSKLAGTGLEYISENYHKFIRSRVEDKLAEIETL